MLSPLMKLGLTFANKQKPIKIDNSRCLRNLHQRSSCRKCEEICPANAIKWNGKIDVEWECIGCELCVAACPTEVFQPKVLSLYDLYKGSLQRFKGKKEILIGCHKVNLKGHDLEIINCLGNIDQTTIELGLANGIEKFSFISGDCMSCPLKRGKYSFEGRLIEWRKFCLGERFDIKSEADYKKTGNSTKQFRQLSRRDFLGLIRKETKETVLETIIPAKTSPWNDGKLNKYCYAKSAIMDEIPLEYRLNRKFIVNEKCTRCSICEKVCPTKAIKIIDEKQIPILDTFQCIDCNLCIDICYRDSITIEKMF